MLKLIIVDDEERVCKVIRYLVDWDTLEVEIAGECRNVPEAIKSIEEIHPDIVITDIRMPGHDGIELIRQMKKLYPGIHFIIVSGYSQFEYAQNAIKYGVDDYLLKPIKKKELLQSINKIKEEIQSQRNEKLETESLRAKASEDAEKIKKGLLLALLHGQRSQISLESIDKINIEYHSTFQTGKYQVLIANPFVDYGEENLYTMRVLLEKTERILHEQLSYNFTECIHIIYRNKIYFLLNGSEENFHRLEKILRKVYVEVLSWKEVFGNIHMYYSLSRRVEYISFYEEGIVEAEERLLDRMLLRQNYFLEPISRQSDVRNEEVLEQIKIFRNNLEALDEESAGKNICTVRQLLLYEDNLTGRFVKQVYDTFTNSVVEIVQKLKMNVEIESLRNTFQEIFTYCDGVEKLFEQFSCYVGDLVKEWKSSKKMEQARPIRLAKQYIQRNFRESLTLEIVSGEVGLNPTYFSNLFKIETGQNFSEYLIEMRIRYAKTLLTDTDLSIADVAEYVGYGDVKYFSKLFKKITGLSPAEYRKLYQ